MLTGRCAGGAAPGVYLCPHHHCWPRRVGDALQLTEFPGHRTGAVLTGRKGSDTKRGSLLFSRMEPRLEKGPDLESRSSLTAVDRTSTQDCCALSQTVLRLGGSHQISHQTRLAAASLPGDPAPQRCALLTDQVVPYLLGVPLAGHLTPSSFPFPDGHPPPEVFGLP